MKELTADPYYMQWSQIHVLGFVNATYQYHRSPRTRIAQRVVSHKTAACRSVSKQFITFSLLREEPESVVRISVVPEWHLC